MSNGQAAHVRTGDEPVEEIYYRKGDIDFCFLLNRRHKNLRVFDYRIGNYQQKRDFFDRIARTEGLRKVFTVVEKQDSKSWRSVGFSREGAIPGYFRTADAYVMSRVYTDDGEPIVGGAPKLSVPGIGAAEKAPQKPRGLALEQVRDPSRLERVTRDMGEGALYAPFRRGLFTPDVGIRGRIGKRDYWVGAETDTSFGHAKVDMMTPPLREADVPILEACLHHLIETLTKRETASLFAVCAAGWTLSTRVYGELGFKVTAKLTDHLASGSDFMGAQVWHRRLSTPQTPRLASLVS
jgi:hypothetical protein